MVPVTRDRLIPLTRASCADKGLALAGVRVAVGGEVLDRVFPHQ
jgi:hypothetical protein